MNARWLLVGVLALAFGLAFGVAYLVGADDEPATPRTVTRGLSAPVPLGDAGAEPIAIPALRAAPTPPATMAPAARPPTGGGPGSGSTPVAPVSPSQPDPTVEITDD